MPDAIAWSTTARLCSKSQRTPKFLQPSPTAETSRSEPPILRSSTSALYSKTDHEKTDMNELILAPTTLPDTPPVEYIEAAGVAGYDGVGLRLHRSPGLPFHPVVGNASLIRDIKKA